MEIVRVVHCTVRRGLGPGTMETCTTVAFDDIEDDLPEEIIKDIVVRQAVYQLKERDCVVFSVDEIINA